MDEDEDSVRAYLNEWYHFTCGCGCSFSFRGGEVVMFWGCPPLFVMCPDCGIRSEWPAPGSTAPDWALRFNAVPDSAPPVAPAPVADPAKPVVETCPRCGAKGAGYCVDCVWEGEYDDYQDSVASRYDPPVPPPAVGPGWWTVDRLDLLAYVMFGVALWGAGAIVLHVLSN